MQKWWRTVRTSQKNYQVSGKNVGAVFEKKLFPKKRHTKILWYFIFIFVYCRKNDIRRKYENLLGYFSTIRTSKIFCYVTSVVAVLVVKTAKWHEFFTQYFIVWKNHSKKLTETCRGDGVLSELVTYQVSEKTFVRFLKKSCVRQSFCWILNISSSLRP